MGTRWTYRKKTDENGTFTRYRGRLVAKGFSQILGVNYFESFSPIASFDTIRTWFALSALPMFKVYQYDVQVANYFESFSPVASFVTIRTLFVDSSADVQGLSI